MRTLQNPHISARRVAIYGDLAEHRNQLMAPLMATWPSILFPLIIRLVQHRIRHRAEQRIQALHIP